MKANFKKLCIFVAVGITFASCTRYSYTTIRGTDVEFEQVDSTVVTKSL